MQTEAGEADNARYQQYSPQQLQKGFPHPDCIVESGSLAAVRTPQIHTNVDALQVRTGHAHPAGPLPHEAALTEHAHAQADWESRALSNAQLEAVAYAVQRFAGKRLPDGSRAAFFLGDGAGVGKGRQIAALTKVMWGRGTRRVLWLSHCNDLREDARRDMADMGIRVPGFKRPAAGAAAGGAKPPAIKVWPEGNMTPPQANLEEELGKGVLFATYHLLIAGTSGVVKQIHELKKYEKLECASPTPSSPQPSEDRFSGVPCSMHGCLFILPEQWRGAVRPPVQRYGCKRWHCCLYRTVGRS